MIVLEAQTDSPIIYYENINHKVSPIWDETRETLFSTIECYTLDEELSCSEVWEDIVYFERDPKYTESDMTYFQRRTHPFGTIENNTDTVDNNWYYKKIMMYNRSWFAMHYDFYF